MLGLVVLLLTGFELKHFIADYCLQAGWMIAGKGDFRAPGGYAHAGVHAVGSVLALLLVRPALPVALGLIAGEFVVHYLLDYAKAHYGHGVDPDAEPARFWAFHGLDQLFHQLTYIVMTWIALASMGYS